jgi:O-antigen/teichoic acid export membrane protein
MGFAIAFTGLFTAFGDLGFTSAHLKLVSENKDLGRCIGTFFFIRTALTALIAIVALLTIYFIKRIGNGFESRTHELIVYIFLGSLVFKNILSTITLTFDGKLETAKSQLVEFIMMLTNATLSIFIAIIMPNVILLAGASLTAAIVALVVALYLFKGYPMELPVASSMKKYVSFAAPLAVVAVLRPLYYYTDTLLIQFFNSSKDVGYYYGAQKLPNFILLISDSLLMILLAATSQLHSQENMEGLRELCRKAEHYLSLIVSPLVIFLIIFAKQVIEILLGKQYLPSAPIMQLLLAHVLFLTISRPASILIVGIGRTKLYALLEVLLFPILAICYLVFIPQQLFGLKMIGLGTRGAALSLMLMSILSVITVKTVVFRLVGVKINGRVALHSLVGLLSCIVIAWIASMLSLSRLVFMPLFFIIACAVYVAILWSTRQINKGDIDLFVKLLNVREMKDYLRTELKL